MTESQDGRKEQADAIGRPNQSTFKVGVLVLLDKKTKINIKITSRIVFSGFEDLKIEEI